jgi:hypothetical protein
LPALFSYVVRTDYETAPNSFWDVCTLVIFKPRIRRKAQVGDWILGTGSAGSPCGEVRDMAVYAMRVTDKMMMPEYEVWMREYRPEKVLDLRSRDPRHHVGDAIYDFAEDPPRTRPGVHDDSNRDHDLSGEYALLSEHYYYFGDYPIALSEHLQVIVKRGPGHRGPENAPYVEPFLDWLTGLRLQPNSLQGDPSEWLKCRPASAQVVQLGPRPRRRQVAGLRPRTSDQPGRKRC